MLSYKKRAGKVLQKIQELAKCGDFENKESRFFGSETHQKCRNQISTWMKAAGLETRIDTIGNVRGILRSANPQAKIFVMGSHYDSILQGGLYNGSLGVISAINIAENLISNKTDLPFHLEIIAFCEHEGLRFHTPFLGSKSVTGKLKPEMLERKDKDGITLEDFLISQDKDITQLKTDKIPQKDWLGYYEIQMEEGPILHKQQLPVAVVAAIAGRKLIEITFEGKDGHAGTIPMEYRKDALCAAAQFILEAEEYAEPSRRNVLVTVGKIEVKKAAANKIPGRVSCTLDIRSSDPARLSKAYEALNKLCERICHKRGIYFEWKFMHETEPVLCDENMRLTLGKSIRKENIDLLDIVSGASNDASVISTIAPVALLFVKCFKGTALEKEEKVKPEDIAVALQVSENFLQSLASGAAL